jgi:hypothetical protein
MKKYPTIAMLVACVAAHRHNKGYIKHSTPNTLKTDVIGTSTIVSGIYCNSAIVRLHLEKKELLEITDSDISTANDIIKHYQHKTFTILQGKHITDYTKKIIDNLEKPEISIDDIRLMASVPKTFYIEQENAKIKKRIIEETDNTSYVDDVNKKIRADIEVILAEYIDTYKIYHITAITSTKHLVAFFHKKEFKVPSHITITGIVKQHSTDGISGFKVSRLNRVKIKNQNG